MRSMKQTLRIVPIAIVALQLTACAKTVQWEEEVPLNTGETIWVKRTDTYKPSSEAGNPLQFAWELQGRSVEFIWQSKPYKFHTDSTELMMLYALEASNDLVVVAWSKDCAKRGFGEFRWSNGGWQLQPNISQKLIGQPRNLMSYFSSLDGAIPARVTKEIRTKEDTAPNRGKTELNLDVSTIANNCSGKK